jgi:hypothetical protein
VVNQSFDSHGSISELQNKTDSATEINYVFYFSVTLVAN